ncbi:MAG: cytochrome c [candidate division Zixibacteria bacterium]|nr:cytochrome c [candidate division Zixibacteria bacterium]
MRHRVGLRLAIFAAGLVAAGCVRDLPSNLPPIHINPNMDDQPKYEAQEKSAFFADGSTMRPPVFGTVARGQLNDNIGYMTGIDAKGDTLRNSPVPLTAELLARGEERYKIYCTPCHGLTGGADNIKGLVIQRGMLPPPSYHEQRLLDAGDGYIFWVMTNGKGNMRPYRFQVPVADRWAIVAYLRTLQLSQNATAADVPADQRGSGN